MSLPDSRVEDPRAQRNFDHLVSNGLPVKVLDHVPTDADFAFPVDGQLAIKSTATVHLYMRINDTWTVI